MKTMFHTNLTQEKWNNLTVHEQILNIASELTRAVHMEKAGQKENTMHSLDRVLELIDLTSHDNKWKNSALLEMRRLRELISSIYIKSNEIEGSIEDALRMLLQFNPATSQVEIA